MPEADTRTLFVDAARALDGLRVAARREGTKAFERDDGERAASVAEFLSSVVEARSLLQNAWDRSPFAPTRGETVEPVTDPVRRAAPTTSTRPEPFEVWLREEFPGLPYSRRPRGWFHINGADGRTIVIRQRKCQNRVHTDKWWWEVSRRDMEEADFLAFYGSSPYQSRKEQHRFWMIVGPHTIQTWLPQLGLRDDGQSWDLNIRLRDGKYVLYHEREGLSKDVTQLIEGISPLQETLYHLLAAAGEMLRQYPSAGG